MNHTFNQAVQGVIDALAAAAETDVWAECDECEQPPRWFWTCEYLAPFGWVAGHGVNCTDHMVKEMAENITDPTVRNIQVQSIDAVAIQVTP